MKIESFKELTVYTKGYELAMAIYQATQSFPKEERYAITSQIRRSSRAVCACLAESWAKRRYEAHFISKLTDADAENNETGIWLDFAHDCGHLTPQDHERMQSLRDEVGAMLGSIIRNPTSFLIKK